MSLPHIVSVAKGVPMYQLQHTSLDSLAGIFDLEDVSIRTILR
jgi:hypothetical protein